jgi:deoxycytidylate deaminase
MRARRLVVGFDGGRVVATVVGAVVVAAAAVVAGGCVGAGTGRSSVPEHAARAARAKAHTSFLMLLLKMASVRGVFRDISELPCAVIA